MTKRIVIDPVTRIEGHAKITIHLDDAGQVADARFHVAEFRGFEAFCQGRPFWEMPGITARICGICPVSHLLASSRAGDALLSVTIPLAAARLRRLMNLAQILQSHALSFFHLSAPDLLLGMDSDPSKRNIFGLIAAEPDLARRGIRLRQLGQEVIEALGGKKIHPAWSVPGGVREPLRAEARDAILSRIPEALSTLQTALIRFKDLLDRFQQECETFGNFPTAYLAMIGPNGLWEHDDGQVRVIDSYGTVLVDALDLARYQEVLGESVQSDSYLKSPYVRTLGFPAGLYRVGPLARLNVCERMGTPLADRELQEYRQRGGRIVQSSFWYHYARLIEMLASVESMQQLLGDPLLLSTRLRAEAGINCTEGVGVAEAPRGTLFHHYQVDENGLIQKVNLIIATGQNNLAMNQSMVQIARHYVRGAELSDGVLNRLEAGIRAFDPCLSCSTHAIGMMPLHVQLIDSAGSLLDEKQRD